MIPNYHSWHTLQNDLLIPNTKSCRKPDTKNWYHKTIGKKNKEKTLYINNIWLIYSTSRKSNTKNLLFPKVPCVVSLYIWIQKNGCIIKETIPTPFRNYRPSAKGLHLIDTFSACTGEKPGRYLIPYFSGFCPAWTIREHYYDTKNLREK